ncbi:MAG: EAL domain-containing protein [Sulfuricella sp.]|nr:EAL domain-containing protein [Sulfuricella sp.]
MTEPLQQSDQLHTLKLLYVEDDPEIRRQLVVFLSRRVGKLLVAENGHQGLELFREESPDVVVTDIVMPIMDGLKMSEGIKLLNPDVPIIVTTAFNDQDFFLSAIEVGIDHYVLKPIHLDALLEAIRKAAKNVIQQREIESKNRELQLAAKVFDGSIEGILISTADNTIVSVNRAFSEITGYSAEEVLGQNPRLLNSGRQSQVFYRDMWDSLNKTGHWQGEIWNRRKNGEIFPQWLTISVLRDEAGEVNHYIALCTDISQRKFDEERIERLAYYDPLTDLPNRVLLQDRLARVLANAQRNHRAAAILMLDLDRFKNINESLGHGVGDAVLQAVAERLRTNVRDADTVARLGGDEYLVVLADIDDAQDVAVVAKKVLDSFAAPISVGDRELGVSLSIGISVYPNDGEDQQTLMKNADSAVYSAKQAGRNTYQFYTRDMNASTLEALMIENALRRALERHELRLYFQPQADMHTGEIIGAEALIRWQHPELGLLAPGAFIPIAEDSGLIIPIGEWVLEEACRHVKEWHDAGFNKLTVAVNMSAVQFRQDNLSSRISAIGRETGVDLGYVELELTESMIMHNAEQMIDTMRAMKTLNLKLSIDDFGTGYSSLSYLKRFPLDKLKIDRSFVNDISDNPADLAISKVIIDLAHNLNLKAIAEGVETEEQLRLLRNNGCDELQGFYFSRPVPAEGFMVMLHDGKRLEH